MTDNIYMQKQFHTLPPRSYQDLLIHSGYLIINDGGVRYYLQSSPISVQWNEVCSSHHMSVLYKYFM